MKKVFVYILVLVVALLLGGILGNVCANIEPLSWLDYMPPLNIKEHHWNLYVLDLTFGLQSKFNIAQVILVIVAIFTAPKIQKLIFKDKKERRTCAHKLYNVL